MADSGPCELAIPTAANAALCGALSGVFWRYQTRISWLPLFILLIVGAKLWPALSKALAKSGEFLGNTFSEFPHSRLQTAQPLAA
jgi:hypothetical protein